jgi:glucokinase
MILAGDLGGTKIHLALYDRGDGALKYMRRQRFATKDFNGLEEIIRCFLGADTAILSCIGIPGPSRGGKVKPANLPWTLDSDELAATLGIRRFYFINDLEANGYGISELSSEKIYSLSEGKEEKTGHRALISAGTGLGESFLIWNGTVHRPYPSEGGHTDYGPRNEDELELLRFLMQRYGGRVSCERVVSGMGMTGIYEFLRDVRRIEQPAWLAEALAAAPDPNRVIAETGLATRSALCEKTLEMFVSAFGAEAGNLALKVLPTGGLYVGGGIAPQILEKLKDGTFMRAFLDKGRLSRLLADVPVRVILDDSAALMGAAVYARARAAEIALSCGDPSIRLPSPAGNPRQSQAEDVSRSPFLSPCRKQ